MKILIVDDERSVVEVLAATLEAYFPLHRVRGVESLNEAIGAAYEEGAVDLLISDIDLGDSDGFQVRSELIQLFPAMQTVFISGADLRDYAATTETLKILRKPLVPEEVIESVREAERNLGPESGLKPEIPGKRLPSSKVETVPPVGDLTPVAIGRGARIAVPAPAGRIEARGSAIETSGAVKPHSWNLWPMASIFVGLAIVALLFFQRVEFRNTAGPSQLTDPVLAEVSATAPADEELPLAVGSFEEEMVDAFNAPSPEPEFIRMGDDFEGADRALVVEAQWTVHPLGQGAHEIVVGEGSLRVRSSEALCATFEAASVTSSYDWVASLTECRTATGVAGLVFGFKNDANFYRIGISRPEGRLIVIRRVDGEDQTLWESEDDLMEGTLSAEFDETEDLLTIAHGEPDSGHEIAVPEFDGGKFGVYVSQTPGAWVRGFEVSLRPGD